MHSLKFILVGSVVAMMAATAQPALADNTGDCGNASSPNPIYVGGSTAMGPVLAALDTVLAKQATPITLVYANAAGQTGSCIGVGFIVADTTPTGACAAGACPTGTGQYTDASGALHNCNLPADAHLDVGISDVFATSCPGVATQPADIKDTQGPIQAMNFIISRANPSPPQAITAEEGYFVFGFGGAAGMASPWLKVALQFIRDSGSGTQQMTMRAIGLPGDYINKGGLGTVGGVKGTKTAGGDMATTVANQTDPAAIGIVSSDIYDANRGKLRSLAFRAFKQKYAYYADSGPNATDKQNVRDGHYFIWGPVHFLVHMNGAATARPNAQKFLDIVNGVTPVTPSILDTFIGAHVIPQCAMKVKRDAELGPMTKYAAPDQCGCYFESKVATTSCSTCPDLADGANCASGGVCRGHIVGKDAAGNDIRLAYCEAN
jgi:hypothetical protein